MLISHPNLSQSWMSSRKLNQTRKLGITGACDHIFLPLTKGYSSSLNDTVSSAQSGRPANETGAEKPKSSAQWRFELKLVSWSSMMKVGKSMLMVVCMHPPNFKKAEMR